MADMTWECRGRILDVSRPLVMGVLNVTPDSFFDGGRYSDPVTAVARGYEMVSEGASIVDVGGESSRPGSAALDAAEEIARVRPIVSALSADPSCVVSIDTRHAQVAKACVAAGASIINDISGFRDAAMVDVAARCDAGLIVMHMLGEPETMQDRPTYTDVVEEVRDFLKRQALRLRDAGVAPGRIAVDPGIGFGKELEHNLALLHGLGRIASLGYPVVLGVSRKRFIGALTGTDQPAQRLPGSLVAAAWGALHGAAVLRVHDVADTVQALTVARALAQGRPDKGPRS
jgi:dihydropteroate synthase